MRVNPHSVPAVPGLCRALCRAFHSCAGCAGSTHTRARVSTAPPPKPKKQISHGPSYPRHTRHTRHNAYESCTYAHSYPAQHPAHPAQLFFFLKKGMMMMESNKAADMGNPIPGAAFQATRRISVTQNNAADARAMVRRWPALDGLVQSLQAQGAFPGLRGLTVTLTGPEEWVAKGLAAVQPENAPGAVLSARA